MIGSVNHNYNNVDIPSANGATSISVRHRTDPPWRAWGNAPGKRRIIRQALKARFIAALFPSRPMLMSEIVMNRTFSALTFSSANLGRCPRLRLNQRRWR